MGSWSLLLLVVFLFVLANLVVLPLWLAATSLAGAMGSPGGFLKVAASRRLRQNHALEHATLNVLEERFGPQSLSGLAREDGFVLKGVADPEAVRAAAEEGLARLKRGERPLAYHPRCGTSRAAAKLVTSAVMLVLLLGFGRFNLLNVVLAMVVAHLAGPALGRVTQRYLTTSARVDDVFITAMEYGPAQSGWALLLTDPARAGVPMVVLVKTAAPRLLRARE